MPKLMVKVYDDKRKQICCRIILRPICQKEKNYEKRYFQGIYCNGEIELEIDTGAYILEVYKGKFFWPFKQKIQINSGDPMYIEVKLKRITEPKKFDLYSFDAHSHVSRMKLNKKETCDLEKASIIMKGEDYDFFFAGPPYDLDTHMQAMTGVHTDTVPYREKYSSVIQEVSDEDFYLDIGNEIVKGRYGHAFMLNYTQKPPFDRYYDAEFDEWQLNKRLGDEPKYNLEYMHEVLLKEKEENSAAVIAHPTSWWYEGECFITNIAATLGFELLAGSIDAMVIMGYDSDKTSYQELWYHILNQGYFLPGVAELDIIFDGIPTKHNVFKTFTYAQSFSPEHLARGVKAGRNIVTSGPLLLLKIDGRLPGDVIKRDSSEGYMVNIEAYRCFEAPLERIQLIVNGKVYREYNLHRDLIQITDTICMEQDGFVIAKCYDCAGNVAITNPVYIRNEPFVNKEYRSFVTIEVLENKKAANGVYWLGNKKEPVPFKGKIEQRINVATPIHICVNDNIKTVKLFNLEKLQSLFRNLYLGTFNKERKFKPGEVPPEAFGLARIREILDNVHLIIEF